MTIAAGACREDSDLAARDSALPGIAAALDGDALAELLAARLDGVSIEGAEATYVRYKPGTSCLVAHRLGLARSVTGAPASIDVYARVQRLAEVAKLRKVEKRSAIPSALGPGGLLFEDLGMAVYAFPNDRRLRSLGRLTGDEAGPSLLERLLPDRPDLWSAGLHRLSYKPERRFVAGLVVAGRPQAVVRAYDTGFERARRSTSAHAGSPVAVPGLLGASRTHQMLFVEWLQGTPLDVVLDESSPGAAPAAHAGGALAALHAQATDGLPAWTAELESVRLAAAAEAVGATLPQLRRPAAALARRLGESASAQPASDVTVHGDFSADQVVVGASGTGLIDLDRAMLADPAFDLASFAGGLERDVISGRRTRAAADAAREDFLAAYGRAAPRSPDVPGRRVAAALLCLAPEPFRRREPGWAERTGAIVDRAAELAAA